jgi:hypothetical protein
MKNFLTLIEDDQVEELRSKVFEQRLSDSKDGGTYTTVLDEDEEVALVTKIADKSDYWLGFLKEYIQHYPLCNTAVCELFANFRQEVYLPFFKYYISKYGYSTMSARIFCEIIRNLPEEERDEELIKLFCRKAVIWSPEIYTCLDYVDHKYAELYKESVDPAHWKAPKKETDEPAAANE